MALKGTLKDFGIADIFQLISHQSKTGVLHLQAKEQEVRISFVNGDVVRAESATRKKKELLGAMLVRAEVISEAQLEQALGIQKRTLKRLGDVMVEHKFLGQGDLRQFALLQTTETLYKLFNWESGTYAFEAEEVVYDADTIQPIRSENVLMEGFRMVDEWPMIRKKITSYEMTFKKVKDLDGEAVAAPEGKKAEDGDGGDIDDAFDEMFSEDSSKTKKKSKDIGTNERKIFTLLRDDRDVQKLIDLSRLGEFETCKSLMNLLNKGYIKAEARKEQDKGKEKPGGRKRSFPIGRILIQAAMYVFILALGFGLYLVLEQSSLSVFGGGDTRHFQEPATRTLLDQAQVRRLESALEVYRLENGKYPQKLSALVESGLLSESDVRYPWRNERAYEATDDEYTVLRPFD